MRVLLNIAALLLLAGCGSAPVRVQEISVPVPVYCSPPEIRRPLFAVDGLPVGSGIWEQMKALRAERLQARGYIEELEAAVKACSRPSS